jgi:hypothetical protein
VRVERGCADSTTGEPRRRGSTPADRPVNALEEEEHDDGEGSRSEGERRSNLHTAPRESEGQSGAVVGSPHVRGFGKPRRGCESECDGGGQELRCSINIFRSGSLNSNNQRSNVNVTRRVRVEHVTRSHARTRTLARIPGAGPDGRDARGRSVQNNCDILHSKCSSNGALALGRPHTVYSTYACTYVATPVSVARSDRSG